MRKLFSFNMISLDGFFAGPNGELDWHHVDAEFNDFAIVQLHEIGTLLFGRVTYEMMASYWPTPTAQKDDPTVARLMNRIPKIVFSTTLQKTDWENSRVVRDDIAAQVALLKEQPGQDLAVFGSANLLSTLVHLNLVDEHRVIVNPVVLGNGKPLFEDVKARLDMKLIGTQAFHNGNVLLRYQPATSQVASSAKP